MGSQCESEMRDLVPLLVLLITIQVESLFERVPRRRNNRWSEVEEQVEEEVEVGDRCWGCGVQTCVFKRGRHGRPICRPGRPWGEIIYTDGKEFPSTFEPGSICWGCGQEGCEVGLDGRCRSVDSWKRHQGVKKKKKNRRGQGRGGRRSLLREPQWMLRM